MNQAKIRGLDFYESGNFRRVLTEIRGRMDLTPDELALLGWAELHLGYYGEAELHLLRPHLMGSERGTIGLAAIKVQTGEIQFVRQFLGEHLLDLTPEYQARAWQILGEAELIDHDLYLAEKYFTNASQLFLKLNKEYLASIALSRMAWVWALQCQLEKARQACHMALALIPEFPNPTERARTFSVLAWIEMVGENFFDAHNYIEKAISLIKESQDIDKIVFVKFVLFNIIKNTNEEKATCDTIQEIALLLPPLDIWNQWVAMAYAQGNIDLKKYSDAIFWLSKIPRENIFCQKLNCELYYFSTEIFGEEEKSNLEKQLELLKNNAARLGQIEIEAEAEMMIGCFRKDKTFINHSLENAMRYTNKVFVRKLLKRIELIYLSNYNKNHEDSSLFNYINAAKVFLESRNSRPYVRIYTLGNSQILFNGKITQLPSTATAILALLFLNKEVDRCKIEISIYPDLNQKIAESRLKQDILKIRSLIDKDSIEVTGPHYAKKYQLGKKYIWHLDVDDFFGACHSWDSVKAFSLLNGTFLESIDSEWAYEARDKIEQYSIRLTKGLVEKYIAEDMQN